MKIFNPQSDHFHFSKKETTFIYGLFVLLLIFLCFKAALMGVFHDELITFYFYIKTGVILPPEAHLDANNHFVNSVLSRWSYQLFGPSPFAIRLPNVLAYPFYFYAVFKLAGRFKAIIIRWSLALSLTMCVFIFEYFAMCRGYGLSMMFLVIAMHLTLRLLESNHPKYVALVAVTLWFGVASNMVVLPYALVIFIFMFLHSIWSDFKTDKKLFFIKLGIMAVLGITFLIHASWSFEMRDAGLLVHGDLDGLYEVTIVTVSEHVFGKPYLFSTIMVYVIFWSAAAALMFQILKNKSMKRLFSVEGFMIYLLLASILLIFLMAKILEINYPRDRTGMHLLIFLFGSFCAVVSWLSEKWKFSSYGSVVLLFFPLQFLYFYHPADSMNFDSGRHSERLYNFIRDIKNDNKFPLTISSRGNQQLTWYYTNYLQNQDQGGTHYTGFPQLEADIILKEDIDIIPQNDSIYELYDSVYHDQHTHITCFKRKEMLERKLIHIEDVPDATNINHEYYGFMKIESDSLNDDCLYIGAEFTLTAQDAPFRSRIVATVDQTKDPTNLYYEFVELDWIQHEFKGEHNNVVQGTLIHRVPKDAETIALYLWNPDKTMFSIRDGKCYLYRLNRDF